MSATSPVVLQSAADLRAHVKRVLEGEPEERRVALVAFVGRQPLAIAARVAGLEVVCWPKPGATCAEGVRDLLEAGATVRFSPGMHRKVYWSQNNGAVVGSTNLSHAGLGGGNVEACVYFPDSSEVPIDALLADAPKDSTPFAQRMTQLYAAPEPKDGYGVGRKGGAPSFAEWCRQWRTNADGAQPWKLGAWDTTAEFSKEALALAAERYGRAEPDDLISARKGTTYEIGDWVLTVNVAEGGLSELAWLYVQAVTAVMPDDTGAFEADYPFQAVEFTRHDRRLAPFKLSREGPVKAALLRLAKGRPARLLDVVDLRSCKSKRLQAAFAAE